MSIIIVHLLVPPGRAVVNNLDVDVLGLDGRLLRWAVVGVWRLTHFTALGSSRSIFCSCTGTLPLLAYADSLVICCICSIAGL